MKTDKYVGLDVHKDTTVVAVAEAGLPSASFSVWLAEMVTPQAWPEAQRRGGTRAPAWRAE